MGKGKTGNLSAGKESAYDAEDLGSIPGLRRSPGEGKGYPLQYSGLEKFYGLYSPWSLKEPDQLSLSSRGFLVPLHFLPCPFPVDLPDPGIKPGSPSLLADSFPVELPGKTVKVIMSY